MLPLEQRGKFGGQISAAVRHGGPPAELGLGCVEGGLVGIAAGRLPPVCLRFPSVTFFSSFESIKISNSWVLLASNNL